MDDDGLLAKDDTVEGKRGFCKVSTKKESSLGILWFYDSLCPRGEPGMFLVENLLNGCWVEEFAFNEDIQDVGSEFLKSGASWVRASELIPTIDNTIKELRERGESERKVDELHRTKYDLKRLGDERVEVDRAPNGAMRLKNPEKVRLRAKDIEKDPERKLGLGLKRGRGR